ncbi:MAG: SCO family protein [Chitinophagaceae bacterium]
MNKNALLALCVAILLPLSAYLWLKSVGDTAVIMPRKYFLDTVITGVVNGKQQTDSIWHRTANITLVNQLGDTVSLYDIQGKIIVADFFFTHCRSICPRLTRSMSKLQQSFIKGGNMRKKVDTSVVHFLSFSIDADRDSVSVLKDYADRFGVNHDNWWMLTGDKKKIADFAFKELRVDQYDSQPIDSDFVHTNRFVVLDKDYVVRGFYNGLDTNSVSKLARDIGALMLEKNRKKKSTVFTQIIDLSWLWLIIIVAVIFFVVYMQGRRKING